MTYAILPDYSIILTKGGEGSGNFEHEGRPGEVGGSGEGGEGGGGRRVRGHIGESWGMSEEDAIADMIAQAKIAGVDVEQELAEDILSSVSGYTEEEYAAIRKAQRASAATRDDYYKERADYVEQFIEFMPKYEGTVYRGIAASPKAFDKFSKMERGASVDMRGLSSWTSDADLDKVAKSPVKFIVNSKSGVSLRHISVEPTEQEVAFSSRSRFVVESVVKSGSGTLNVYLNEAP